jgi:hypothetical protein
LSDLDATVQFNVRANERYFVVVGSEARTTGDYRLALRTVLYPMTTSDGPSEKPFPPGDGKGPSGATAKTAPLAAAASQPEILLKKTPGTSAAHAARDLLFAKRTNWRPTGPLSTFYTQ